MAGADVPNGSRTPRLAESFGVRRARATSPDELRRSLEDALSANEPYLIEVPCAGMPEPWPKLQMQRIRGR
jgi:thiamine pyrophosphate-dependent acetolactate synthase large subunit-like protein